MFEVIDDAAMRPAPNRVAVPHDEGDVGPIVTPFDRVGHGFAGKTLWLGENGGDRHDADGGIVELDLDVGQQVVAERVLRNLFGAGRR